MNADKKHKRIGIIGHGAEAITAIKIAEAKGYEVVIIAPDNSKNLGLPMNTVIKDEMKSLADKINPLVAKSPVLLPETRRERRAKARKKKRK